MSTATHNWIRLCTLTSGHRIFRDHESQKLAIADSSGATPDRTEDGVCWLAADTPAHVESVRLNGKVELYVSLRVYGPRIGNPENGMHTSVEIADIPALKKLGFSFAVVDEDAKKAITRLRSQVADLELAGL